MTSPDCPYVLVGRSRPEVRNLEEECALWKRAAQEALSQIQQNASRAQSHEKASCSLARVSLLRSLKAHLEVLIQEEEKKSWEDHTK